MKTVAELISELQAMPQDAYVMVSWGGRLDMGDSTVEGLRKEEYTEAGKTYREVFIEY